MQTVSKKPSAVSVPRARSLLEILRRCTVLANIHGKGKFGPDDAKVLEDLGWCLSLLWQMQAKVAAEAISGKFKTYTDDSFPGYVFINEGTGRYALPFFMVDVFPEGKLLEELNSICRSIRVAPDSTVCISGSGCALGMGAPVADIDFCEYLKNIDPTISEKLIGITQTNSNSLRCVRVTVSKNKKWERPWPAEVLRPTKAFVEKLTKQLKPSLRRKIDFVSNTSGFGVLEVTNKLIAMDYAYRETGEAKESFSFQEAPVIEESWTPRNLSDPLEVGRYINWLMGAVTENLEKSRDNPRYSVKALRRAFPLSRILFAPEEMKSLRNVLTNGNGVRLAALHDRCELHKSISSLGDNSFDAILVDLKATIDGLRGQDKVDNNYNDLTTSENNSFREFAIEVRASLDGIVASAERMLSLS